MCTQFVTGLRTTGKVVYYELLLRLKPERLNVINNQEKGIGSPFGSICQMEIQHKMKFPVFFCALLVNVALLPLPSCFAENILVYEAVGSHSTRLSIWPLMEALAEKGHKVTFLSPFDTVDGKGHPNLREYVPEKLKASMENLNEHLNFYDIRKNNQIKDAWYALADMGVDTCKVLYSDPDFVSWAKSSKFDLVIIEVVMNECAYGLVHLFNAKLIVFSTTSTVPWMMEAYGLPDETSSIPETMFGFPPGKDMSFFQRFSNALAPISFRFVREYQYFPILEEITRKGLGMDLPKFRDIEKNTSLMMLTSHYSQDYPRSLPPNAILIGGVVSSGKPKPMPKEMEDFINKSKDGFIYISFGTIAEFIHVDPIVRKEFIKGLLKFPNMRYIWKATLGVNETLPDNFLVIKWAPQQTILAHPKLKAFITHAGMGSAVEAIHNKVPLICVPVFAEQDYIARFLSTKGVGITLEIVDLKHDDLQNALSEVLTSPKYRDRMEILSAIFKDRYIPPLENAVWWTEFVLRHDTNDFLVPPSVHLSWWVKRNLDIWATVAIGVLTVISISLTLLYILIKSLRNLIFGKKQSKTKIKTK